MLKKLISSILAIAMIGAMSTSVFAEETEGKSINVENGIEANYIDENGKVIPLEIDATITPVTKKGRTASGNEMYSLSVYVSGDTKTTSESGNTGGNVLSSGILTMLWIDGKGADTFNNEIVSLSGSWSTASGSSFTEGSIKWGANGTSQAGHNSVSQSFNQNIGYVGTSLSATSFGYFQKYVNGRLEKATLQIHVMPSILD